MELNLEGEIWKDIPDWEGYYQASNLGRIKSLSRPVYASGEIKGIKKERILKFQTASGYLRVPMQLTQETKGKQAVHRMVAFAFLGKSDLTVDHIDGDKLNNKIENLRYLTHRENRRSQAIRHSKSGVIGVSWNEKKKKWRARVNHNKKEYSLGYYTEKEHAIFVVNEKLKELATFNAPIKPHPHKHEMSIKYLSQNATISTK